VSKFVDYCSVALATSGIAILDPVLAQQVAPGLAYSALELSAQPMMHVKQRMRDWPGVKSYFIQLADFPREAEILVRTSEDLPRRIFWMTGRRVLNMRAAETKAAATVAGGSVPAWRRKSPMTLELQDDKYAGVSTAEGPRSCAACDHLGADGACNAAADSGIERPLSRVPRRCLAFAPVWDAADQRVGVVLWPELVASMAASSDSAHAEL